MAQVVFIHSFIHSSYSASRVYKASCSFRTRDTTVWRVYICVDAYNVHVCAFSSFLSRSCVSSSFSSTTTTIVVVVMVIVKVFVRARHDECKINIRTAGNGKVCFSYEWRKCFGALLSKGVLVFRDLQCFLPVRSRTTQIIARTNAPAGEKP